MITHQHNHEKCQQHSDNEDRHWNVPQFEISILNHKSKTIAGKLDPKLKKKTVAAKENIVLPEIEPDPSKGMTGVLTWMQQYSKQYMVKVRQKEPLSRGSRNTDLLLGEQTVLISH